MKRNDPDRNAAAFTLAELLIVVAIIAVLVAIAIPIFTSQLEKSREAVDLANVRAAYAEVMTAAISEDGSAVYDGKTIKQGDGTYKAVVTPLAQHKDGWTTNVENMSIGGAPSDKWIGEPKKNGSCTVSYDPGNDSVTIDWTGGTSGGTTVLPDTGNSPNADTITNIGKSASALLEKTAPNQTVTIKVNKNGTYEITVSGGHGNKLITAEQVEAELKKDGTINSEGTISYAEGDEMYPNGYTVTIEHNNNGNNDNSNVVTVSGN